MINHISIVIITRDVAPTLEATLNSVVMFTNVLLFDNGSTDTTLEIARRYSNVTIKTGEFTGFGPTKNTAIDLANNNWVFCLDADEQMTAELAQHLESWDCSNPLRVGLVLRKNYFMGKHIDKAGWGNDYLVRLFNRKFHRYNQNQVHESVETTTDTVVETLPQPISHNAVQHIGQFLVKIDRYSEFRRRENRKDYTLLLIILKSFFAFFRSFILQGGILAGWRGLVISWNQSNGVFYKYMKPYIDKKEGNH